MAASATDFFTEVGSPGTATTLSAPGHTIGGTAFTVVSTTNWPTTTGAIFAIDTYDITTGARVPGSYTEWEGVVASSTSITGGVLRYGTDQNYSAGATTRVYIPVSSSRENRLAQGMQVAHNQDGTIKNNAITSAAQITDGIIGDAEMATSVKPVTLFNENTFDHVVSGCVWTADAAGSTLLASMTSGVVMLAGKRLTVAAVTSRTFTASKDTYIDISDNGDGTGLIAYDATTANNGASVALVAGSMRLGIIVTGAGNIATAASINQGQEDRVLPIASSIAYTVTDSLGNLICPRDPNRKVLGYRQRTSSFVLSSSQTTQTQITGLTCPVIVPTGRKVKVSAFAANLVNATTTNTMKLAIWDGVVVSGTELEESNVGGSTGNWNPAVSIITTPAANSKTYNIATASSGATNVTVTAAVGAPAFVLVELI